MKKGSGEHEVHVMAPGILDRGIGPVVHHFLIAQTGVEFIMADDDWRILDLRQCSCFRHEPGQSNTLSARAFAARNHVTLGAFRPTWNRQSGSSISRIGPT
jgi:hypothetical protein